jgi:hypothetical protein
VSVFERFSQQARQVIVHAQEEARGLRHNYIGIEHELLGLTREQDGVAARVLDALGVTESRVRQDIIRMVGTGEALSYGQIPFTPRAMALLKDAEVERLALGDDEVETEHILLGLLRGDGGTALRVLRDAGLERETVRNEIFRVLRDQPSRAASRTRPVLQERRHPAQEVRPRLAAISVEQAESFAILRRRQLESDRLPRSRWQEFDLGAMGHLGLNSALARRAVTPAGDVWVVPGSGYLCLAVAGGMTCNSTDSAARRGMVTWTSRRSTGQGIVQGLVPDGVEEITLVTADNASTAVQVSENVYGAVLDGYFGSGRFFGPTTGMVELGPYGYS